jgi:hypothetical protein
MSEQEKIREPHKKRRRAMGVDGGEGYLQCEKLALASGMNCPRVTCELVWVHARTL